MKTDNISGINVLSLFNGISCGRVALERAGIPVNRYVSYEIDKYANKIAQKNYPDDEYNGDVTTADFTQYKGFDLLIGGSPCTYWSIAKKGREVTPDGIGGQLFMHFVRALKESGCKYFLYENNYSIHKDIKAFISEQLGVELIMINSALVSAQQRKRCYWTNILNVQQPDDKGILLKDIIESGLCDRDKIRCLLSSCGRTTTREYFITHQGQMCAEPVICQRPHGFNKGGIKKDKSPTLTATGSWIYNNHIVEPVPINTTVDDKARILKAQYSNTGPANILGNLNGKAHFNSTGVAEPVRVDHIGKSKGQANRVYSTEGKSVCLQSQAGGGGALTGLYAIPVEFKEDSVPTKAISNADGKTYPVYIVSDGQITIKENTYPINLPNGYYIIRKLTPIETERLQTLPDNYTEGVSNTQRYKCIGNSWTVDVIAHILKNYKFERDIKMNYKEFLENKVAIAPSSGFEVENINPALFPHQADSVRWCCKGGNRAIFASFGNGKTVMGLETAHQCAVKSGKQSLIICPLGVKQEFTQDAVNLLGYEKPEYVRTQAEVENCKTEIMITNYERVRDGDIDVSYFGCTVLDEAAVLRSFGSKTYQTFLGKFKNVQYKFVMTATPDPNKYKELIHYAGYLGIMDTGQALTRFFQRDSTKANNLTIYPHKEKEFWLWVSSWALFYTKPSDFNPEYSDDGYVLPKMKINEHRLITRREELTADKDGQLKMFEDAALSLKDAAKIKKDSIKQRIAKAAEIVANSPEDHFILWHDREEERHEIKRLIPKAVEIYGSQDLDIREKNVIDFSEGKTQILATKKSISGSGCNFQRHCHRAIFCGIDESFNDFIQSIHRIYRFGQTEEVVIDIIYMDEEDKILQDLYAKWKRYDYQTAKMVDILKQHGLSNSEIKASMVRTMGVDRVKVRGENFTAYNNDCVEEMRNMPDNSVDLMVTSIPFSNHYEYTPSYNDFGHNENNEKFFEQLDYLTPEVLRVIKPGRVVCVHVKDRILFGNATGDGMPTVDPFSDMTVMHYIKHGFKYMGRIVITTDVVRENNQTYRLGWTEQCKDGTKMGVGCPEYVLLFRKLPTDKSTAYADEPVKKSKELYSRGRWQLDAHSYWRSSGNTLLDKEQLKSMPIEKLQKVYNEFSRNNVYSYEEHVKLVEQLDKDNKLPATFMMCAPASWNDSVWDDIVRMRTLNSEQSRRKQQMHVCPLQLDTVERLIERYSNKGETVLDFFGGIMTVPYVAVNMGRYGIGIELNSDYFRDGVAYLKSADVQQNAPTLFDFIS